MENEKLLENRMKSSKGSYKHSYGIAMNEKLPKKPLEHKET